MKRYFPILLFLLTPSVAWSETVTVSFDEIPTLVTTQNKTVLAGDAFVKGAKAQTGHLARSFVPQVHLQGGGEVFQTGTLDVRTEPVGSVEGSLNLFRSGKDVLEEKIRERQTELTKVERTQRQLHEIARARLLYADALFYRDGITGVGDVLAKSEKFNELVSKKIEAGLITRADQLELDILKSRFKQEKALLKEDYEHALNDLKVSLGLSLTTDLRLSSSMASFSKNAVPAVDLKSHYEVQLLKEKSAIARLKNKQSARWWAPELDAYGGYALHPYREREYFDLNDRDEAVGGLRLSMNLLDLSSASQSRSYGYQAKGYALEAEQRSEELKSRHERLLHELKTRRYLIGQLNENIARGNEYVDLSLDEYQRGIGSSFELFGALREQFEERRRLAETRRDYFRIKAELMALAGE